MTEETVARLRTLWRRDRPDPLPEVDSLAIQSRLADDFTDA
ncbi:hypothetical protein [Pleurocapsa sp. PCC 7327]|nr:hypothetical protein [Pleurocapsa sp. PCC 7327]